MENETRPLSYELASALYHYDPVTGEFMRKTARGLSKTGHIHKGYLVLNVIYRKYYAHRIAFVLMTGAMPDGFVDHIDGNILNNAFSNLRIVSRIVNGQNMARSKANKSGVTGVFWSKDPGRWRASIKVNRRQISLSSDGTLLGAACARKSAELFYCFHENHGRNKA